jgi:DNA polymerase I-like protein with 3'-5' exonuclease and polymerase domains
MLENLQFDIHNPSYEYITTDIRLREVSEILEDEKIISLDTEGTSLDYYYNKLLLVQIGIPDKAFIFDALKIKQWGPLKKIIENPKILKIVQNGKYDYGILKQGLGMEIRNIYDTMLAEQIVTNGIKQSASLGTMARGYLDITLDKNYESYQWDRVGVSGNFQKNHLNYAALDVLVLFPIFTKQWEILNNKNLTKIAKLEFSVLPVVSEMELTGSFIDTEKWRKVIADLRIKRQETAKKIQDEIRPLFGFNQLDLFGNLSDSINLNSQQQLLELFNDRLGLNLPSTGVKVLGSTNHPVAKMLLEYRASEKLISAFGENLLSKINKVTGRLHPDFQQIGADTGRFSCSSPNLQQIPRGSQFRSCFVPPKGRKLVTVDYSQQELRVLAEYSQDPTLISAYKNNKDLHTVTAAMMYGVPEEKVRKDVERQAAKTINFGLMYGRGANSLGVQLGINQEEAKKLLDMYFKKFSKVRTWLNTAAKSAVTEGYSTTLGGRKRFYQLPDPGDPNYLKLVSDIERKGKNTPIQGSGADMVKYALVFIRERFIKEKIDAKIIHTVHDEIVCEAEESVANDALNMQREEMLRAGRLLLKSVPVEAEGEVSDMWEH